MTKRSTILGIAALVLLAVAMETPAAWAIPAFARKENLACSSCHTAWGYLNSTGRTFKEAGYLLPDEDGELDFDAQPGNQKISESLVFDKVYPIAARIKGYIFDDSKGSDTKIRPVHEFEVFSAGKFWKKGSWFWELEGEDEESFETAMAGSFTWHESRAANFQFGIGPIFHPDPYNSTQDGGHRLTVGHKIPLNIGNSVNARFRKDAQYIAFYGRQQKVFYLLSYSAGNSNPEGEDPNDILGRVAFDFNPDAMLGAFYFDGERDHGAISLSRVGIDWNFAFDDFYVLGMWMSAEEDFRGAGSNDNDAGYLQAMYVKKKNGRPHIVPLLRYGFTELNNGRDELAALTAQLGVYVTENMKLALEVYNELDQEPGKAKGERFTLLADVAF
jgi:hypothetical protein